MKQEQANKAYEEWLIKNKKKKGTKSYVEFVKEENKKFAKGVDTLLDGFH